MRTIYQKKNIEYGRNVTIHVAVPTQEDRELAQETLRYQNMQLPLNETQEGDLEKIAA